MTLPTATGGFGDKPVLTFPDTPAPEDLGVQVLVQGDGEAVQRRRQTSRSTTTARSGSGRMFDNSYDRGSSISFPIGVGAVIGGWDDGLVGKQVGSRVLLSIPPHLGYGPGGMPPAGIRGGGHPGVRRGHPRHRSAALTAPRAWSGAGSAPDQARLVGDDHGLDAVAHPELGQDRVRRGS